ncbi:SaV-like [uncultured Caudovirales phage]|uniref:SaV-like n=1 Tax=uncultured Caudovirales phage TaxID=2100421 RepID=A0A6J5QRI6_9CAUD|nr:SaV-like [uncultured Caudovirales phage]CAB4161164.1 SaV-like [uncultured Caudovirales phage]CAB4187173.1 SaV-like [uncultured Caudovirales phage]
MSDANAVQVGGTHYKDKTLQPWDAIIAWDMGFLDGNALKYLVRFRDKGGVEDLKKARHYIDKLIEVENEKARSKSYE